MPEGNKWTRSNRKEIVVITRIFELFNGDLLRPKIGDLSEADSEDIRRAVSLGERLWVLHVITSAGFERESSFFILFASAEKAGDALLEYPIGSEIDSWKKFRPKTEAFEIKNLSLETRVSISGRGEPPYELLYETLHGAGVYENYKLSRELCDWLGREGARWLKSEYGDNWESVAVMEYCVRHFPATSMACMAARILVGDFVSEYDFDTGYASRELEVLAGGAEALAQKALDAQAQRAKAGGRKSREQRRYRLEALMQAIESLSEVVGHVSESRILEQAWEDAENAIDAMPRTKNIRFDYEVAIRSEEPFKSRYRAVFGKNA